MSMACLGDWLGVFVWISIPMLLTILFFYLRYLELEIKKLEKEVKKIFKNKLKKEERK